MSSLLERLRAALAGQYEVQHELGAGGMGTVFLARDVTLERSVAIKILRPELATTTAADRFLREARILASLSHPNVVLVHTAGEADGVFYYVMDLVEGETLQARLRRGVMSEAEVVKLGSELLDALRAAHERDVIHRDVKPSNIFLVGDRVLLGDFGIAKQTDDQSTAVTAAGQQVGTPAYMPPEQIGGDVTPRTDIYALGMVLYEAITGRRWSIVTSADDADWSGVPRHLVRILKRALAWSPADRWEDAERFRAALSHPEGWKGRAPDIARTTAAALLLLAALFIGRESWDLLIRPGTAAAVSDLAILPVQVGGVEEARFDGADLARLVARQLERLPDITVVSTAYSFPWWEAGGAPPESAAHALRARYAAFATLNDLGDRVVLQLDIYNDRGKPVPGAPRISGAGFDLQALSDSLTLRLSKVVLGDDLPDVPHLTTDPEALRWFLLGEDAFERGAWESAVGYYQSAVGVDTSFVLAWWRLANAWRWVGQQGPYRKDFRPLLDRYGGGLGQLDSLLMAAQLAPAGELRFRIYKDAFDRYPLSDRAAFHYGEELFNRGPLWGEPLESAIGALESAVALNPFLAAAYEHLAWANIRLGRVDAARTAVERLWEVTAPPEEVGPLYAPPLMEQAFAERFEPERARESLRELRLDSHETLAVMARLVGSFDLPGTTQVGLGQMLAATANLPTPLRVAGHIAQGLGYASSGRSDLVTLHFDSAAALSGSPELQLQAAEWRVLPPALGTPGPDEGERERGRRALKRLTQERTLGGWAAWALAMDAYAREDTVTARRWSERVAQTDVPAGEQLGTFLRAMEEAARGRAREALDISAPLLSEQAKAIPLRGESAVGTALGDPFARAALHLKRGEWYEQIGDLDSAEREWLWYEAVDIDGTPAVEAPQTGEIDWALGNHGRFRRGLAALRRGDPEAACRHLRRAAELWASADSATAVLAADASARAEEACGG